MLKGTHFAGARHPSNAPSILAPRTLVKAPDHGVCHALSSLALSRRIVAVRQRIFLVLACRWQASSFELEGPWRAQYFYSGSLSKSSETSRTSHAIGGRL